MSLVRLRLLAVECSQKLEDQIAASLQSIDLEICDRIMTCVNGEPDITHKGDRRNSLSHKGLMIGTRPAEGAVQRLKVCGIDDVVISESVVGIDAGRNQPFRALMFRRIHPEHEREIVACHIELKHESHVLQRVILHEVIGADKPGFFSSKCHKYICGIMGFFVHDSGDFQKSCDTRDIVVGARYFRARRVDMGADDDFPVRFALEPADHVSTVGVHYP